MNQPNDGRPEPTDVHMGLGARTAGVCWILTMYSLECPDSIGVPHLHMREQLAYNMLRTARANPRLPLCILTSMEEGTVLRSLAAVLGRRLATLRADLQVVTLPCTMPPDSPAAAPGECAACALSRQHLPSAPANSSALRKQLALAAATRYSRAVKVRAAAFVPFHTTAILDADAALCAHASRALLGASEALVAQNKSIGARYHSGRKALSALIEPCEAACGQTTDASVVRTRMRCAALCSGRHVQHGRTGCGANTGVLLVRRSAEAVAFAATWYARWYAQLERQSAAGHALSSLSELRATAALYSGDQQTFGSSGLPASSWAHACRQVANLPRTLHMGKTEVSQGQSRVHGYVIGVHGCKGQDHTGVEACALYERCCARRGPCAADVRGAGDFLLL